MGMKTFTYKDVSIKIPTWPFYGIIICEIVADNIMSADIIFKNENLEYVKNGNIKNTMTVSYK